MKAGVVATRGMRVQLSKCLYRRVERAARLTKCHFSKVVSPALESSLPVVPEDLPRNIADELTGWTLLDLSARERMQWEALQQEYLRVSQNKAKAQ